MFSFLCNVRYQGKFNFDIISDVVSEFFRCCVRDLRSPLGDFMFLNPSRDQLQLHFWKLMLFYSLLSVSEFFSVIFEYGDILEALISIPAVQLNRHKNVGVKGFSSSGSVPWK